MLGEEGQAFEIANTWLRATRLTVAAFCVGRSRRAFNFALSYAAQRKQFGQVIGKFQGVSFKLADMITSIDAADYLTLAAAWKLDQGQDANREIAQAKLFASETLARVADEAIQIHGGMGADGRAAARTDLARRPGRADLGRHQRDPAPHHLARPAAAARRLMRSLARLLRPRSIAVFGGKQAQEVVRQCRKIGYPGRIWLVHPRLESFDGAEIVRSVAELPEAPDAAFIAVNRHATPEIVAALAARGTGAGWCASPRASPNPDRRARTLQAALVAAAGDMPMVGPNCYGLISYLDGVTLWPDQHGGVRVERGVAIITQSGNIGLNLTMQRRGRSGDAGQPGRHRPFRHDRGAGRRSAG